MQNESETSFNCPGSEIKETIVACRRISKVLLAIINRQNTVIQSLETKCSEVARNYDAISEAYSRLILLQDHRRLECQGTPVRKDSLIVEKDNEIAKLHQTIKLLQNSLDTLKLTIPNAYLNAPKLPDPSNPVEICVKIKADPIRSVDIRHEYESKSSELVVTSLSEGECSSNDDVVSAYDILGLDPSTSLLERDDYEAIEKQLTSLSEEAEEGLFILPDPISADAVRNKTRDIERWISKDNA